MPEIDRTTIIATLCFAVPFSIAIGFAVRSFLRDAMIDDMRNDIKIRSHLIGALRSHIEEIERERDEIKERFERDCA